MSLSAAGVLALVVLVSSYIAVVGIVSAMVFIFHSFFKKNFILHSINYSGFPNTLNACLSLTFVNI